MLDESMFRLDGKIALITGGSRGLGKAIAEALARQGADVALLARDPDRLAQAADDLRLLGVGVWTHAHDLADHDALPSVYDQICRDTGGVDILINNAAVTFRAPVEEIELARWRRLFQVGLEGPLALAQLFAAERFDTRRPGKIINIGSLMCHGGRPTTAAYTAMKSALHGLTRSLAVEWAQRGINVNTLAPGYMATEMTQALVDDADFDAWVRQRTPLGRWGTPADLAGAAVFLASRASDFVTGQILYVDGGWTAAV